MSKMKEFWEIKPSEWFLVKKSENQHGDLKFINSQKYRREIVRQWILKELIDTYNYPIDWVGERILKMNVDDEKSIVNGINGLVITLESGEPFMLISTEALGYAQSAEESLRSAMSENHLVEIGIATDGSTDGTVFLRKRHDSRKCDYINDIEPYNRPMSSPGVRLYLNNSKLKNTNNPNFLVPLNNRIENLFFELHSYIRDIDGLHADGALDELCKILYTKLYDEESTEPGKPLQLQQSLYGSTDELAATTRQLYCKANEYDIRVFRLKVPQYERSRGVFNAPIRLSSSAIDKIINALQRYSLTKSEADVKGRAFQKVFVPTIRSGMGQYFTPEPVIRFIVDVVKPKVSDLILDPFCGSGHFLSQCLEYVRNQIGTNQSKIYHEFAFGKLHGIEKSDRMVRVAMTDMRLHGDGHSNIRCTDSLLQFSNYPDLEPHSFDLVLTNPPFGSILSMESIAQLGTFELANGKRRVPLEILGLERCLQFLRHGGRMGIVLPDSILSNQGTRYVREWLNKNAKVCAIVSLPIETFSPFGANIKTSVLFLRKWEIGELYSQNYQTALIRIDNVGYDATGRNNEQSELLRAAKELNTLFKQER